MLPRVGHKGVRRLVAIVLGVSILLGYVAWNAFHLAAGRVPPSMLTGITGLPCPTTGGTRSFLALVHGNLPGSLYYNPITVPILVLFAWTLVHAIRQNSGGVWLYRAWVGLLLMGWIIKLLSPTATW